MIEMLLYSRPGHIELLPALPDAWAAVRLGHGVGARGGFVVDLSWRDGEVRPRPRIRSVGGRTHDGGVRRRPARRRPCAPAGPSRCGTSPMRAALARRAWRPLLLAGCVRPAVHVARPPHAAASPPRGRARPRPRRVVTWAASADRMGDGRRRPQLPAGRAHQRRRQRAAGPALQRLRRPAADLRQRLRRACGRSGAAAGPRQQPAADASAGARSVTVPPGEIALQRSAARQAARRDRSGRQPVRTRRGRPGDRARDGHADVVRDRRATTRPRRAAPHWTEPTGSWFYLDAVTVGRPRGTGAVVALGDSITDGWQSTTDTEPALARLPRPPAAGRRPAPRSRAWPTRGSPATRSSRTAPGRAR